MPVHKVPIQAVERAGIVTSYSYIQVIFSALIGIVFFAEVPTVWTILGGALIISGALINALSKAQPHKS